jgi:TolA-binding protein
MKRTGRVLLLLVVSAAAAPGWGGEDAEFGWAHGLYTHQEYKLAAEALTKFLAGYPKSERAGQARLMLAESHYQLKEYAQAAPHFEKYLADEPASPKRPQALERAVKVCYFARDYPKGLGYAETFLKENRPKLGQPDAPPALGPLFEFVLYYAGESAYALKKTDAARSHWEALRKDFPRSKLIADAAEGLAWIAFEAGRFDEALGHANLTASTPRHAKAAACQLLSARCLERLGKFDEALAALDQAAALPGGKELARETALWRALTLLHAKRPAPALAAYRALAQGFAAHAETPAPVAEAAGQLLEDGESAAALELADLYLASFAQGADRAPVARMKARALVVLKRLDEAKAAALAALREAEALPDGEKKALHERPAALMLAAELSGEDGGAQYQAVLKDHAASRFAAPARYQLAYWAGKAGKYDEALVYVEALLREPPKDQPEAVELRRKALFAAADFAWAKQDFARAEKALSEYRELPEVKKDPRAAQAPLVFLRLAWCRYKAQDTANCEKLLEAGLAAGPAPGLRQDMLYLRGLARLPEDDGAPLEAGRMALEDFAALAQEAPDSEFTAHAALRAAQWLAGRDPQAALPWLDRLVERPAFAQLALRADGLLLRARLRYGRKQYGEALADAEALLKRPDVGERAVAARLLKALGLELLPGQAKEAEEAYTELIQAGPAAAPELRQGLRRRAQLRFQAKRFEEAQGDLAAFLGGKEPQAGALPEIEAAVLLAICKKELKDAAGAQVLLEKLAKLELSGAAAFETPFQLGNLAYEAGKHAEAAAWYQKALAAAEKVKDLPREPRSGAWLNLAWSLQRSGQGKEAEAAFAKLVELDPAGPFAAEARQQRGKLLADGGNLESALAAWKELVEQAPNDPLAEAALFEMGAAQAKARRFVDGAVTFEQFLAKHPQSANAREAHCGLAECRLQEKKPDGAKEAFLKALGPKGAESELDEIGERAVLGLAELALAQGDAKEGKKLALRMVIERPASKWLDAGLYLCAQASEQLAEPERAIGYYRKLLEDRPQSARADTARERLKALGSPAP